MADPILSLGATGKYVVALQEGLNQFQGFDFPITGTFDAATKAAVMLFQNTVGLTPDGVVGQQTWDALRAALAQLQQQAVPPAEPPADPNVVQMDPVTITGDVPKSGSSWMMWLGVAALGGFAYYSSKKKRERAGPGKPVYSAATEHDDDEPSEDAPTWEERARAKRKRMRRSELRFGPETTKKPSGGTVMKNTNRKPTFKVRSEESARQVPYTSKGRSGSHSRGGESATDTRRVNEDLWLTQARGSGRSTTPIRHGVGGSLFKANPEHYRKWAQEKAAAENRVVFIVDQKNGRVLYRTGSEPKLSGARRRPKMSDAVIDSLIDEPAIVAASGKVADCEKAAHLLTKRKLLARAEHERAHFKRVVRAVADACRSSESAGVVEAVVERAIEKDAELQEEIEADMPPMQSRMKKGHGDQMTQMLVLLDSAVHRHEGRPTKPAYLLKRAQKKGGVKKWRVTSSEKRRVDEPERVARPAREDSPVGHRHHRHWRREGPRRPPKGS